LLHGITEPKSYFDDCIIPGKILNKYVRYEKTFKPFVFADSTILYMLMVHSHLDYIENSIQKLDDKMDELIKPYENAINLICTIPGVDCASVITIISEIGTDMAQFSSSKRLCCWAGLTPVNNESAGKKKSV